MPPLMTNTQNHRHAISQREKGRVNFFFFLALVIWGKNQEGGGFVHLVAFSWLMYPISFSFFFPFSGIIHWTNIAYVGFDF